MSINKVTEKIKELDAAGQELYDTAERMIEAVGAVQRAVVAFSNVAAETVTSIREYNDTKHQELQKLSKKMLALVEDEQPVQGENK